MFVVRLFGVLFLVVVNGFFAAAEFSLVAVRLSRVHQLVASGNARAKIVQELIGDLHRVVSGVQLGITLSSLAIGALGESTVATFIQSLWPGVAGTRSAIISHAIALATAFVVLTALHVVIGELVPKTVSLARAERIALLVARPFHWFLHTFRWAIELLDGISSVIIKAMGVAPHAGHGVAHSTDELQIQIQQAAERGLLASGEERLIIGAMEFGHVQVREVMVPRPDMHTLPIEASFDEVLRTFATTQRSRIPVFRESEDHILGFVHSKDMLWVMQGRERRAAEGLPEQAFDLRRILREILIVPETKPASELLKEMRIRHTGMAVVVDEFGSLLGLVTLEDLLEQVVGEIHDEFDVVEKPLTLADGAVIFDAALSVRDLDAQYGITIPEDPAYATVGGFVLDQLGFIPAGGESFTFGGLRFTIADMDGKRVARVKVERVNEPAAKTAAAPGERQDTSETLARKPANPAVSRP
jgi:CBS domain containing-hemolysin-like protein